jgi:hypothetical protein
LESYDDSKKFGFQEVDFVIGTSNGLRKNLMQKTLRHFNGTTFYSNSNFGMSIFEFGSSSDSSPTKSEEVFCGVIVIVECFVCVCGGASHT